MVLGIVSIVGFMGFLLGIPAIVLGVIALKKGTGDKGMSITGIVTGAIATLISLLFIAFMVFVFMMAAAEESNSHSSPQDNRPNYPYPRSSSSSEL
jgi:dolichyl-phosphate-mannose--protein O-mannosyl transferase